MKRKYIVGFAVLVAIIMIHGCCAFRNFSADPEASLEPWEKYTKRAEQAMLNQNFHLAEGYWHRAIIEKIKLDSNENDTAYDQHQLSKIYVMQGKYGEAEAAELKFFQLFKDKMALSEIFLHYCSMEEIYQAQGRYADARKAADWLRLGADKDLQDAEKDLRDKDDKVHLINSCGLKFWTAYPSISNYYTEIGNYEEAIKYLQDHVDYCVKERLMSKNMAIAKNNIAMAYYHAGNDAAAENYFRDAAGLNANAVVGFPEDLCKSMTMLGKIAAHRGDHDKALEFFQSARDALHMYRTTFHKVEEADVLGQIGRFYVKQGKPEESAKAYHEAIRLRQATDTQTHPNCADALKGLADVAASRNELTSATLQAREALKVLDTAVVPSHPRLSIELVALSSIETLASHPEQAAPLGARLETILKKPLGPWKEDFLATTAFYAGLLKKAGKTDEAARLEKLYARQKNGNKVVESSIPLALGLANR